MFGFSSSVFRALRLLIACIALALTVPSEAAAASAPTSHSLMVVSRAEQARRPVRARVVKLRAQAVSTGSRERQPARPRAPAPVEVVRARRAFLLNCSLLC